MEQPPPAPLAAVVRTVVSRLGGGDLARERDACLALRQACLDMLGEDAASSSSSVYASASAAALPPSLSVSAAAAATATAPSPPPLLQQTRSQPPPPHHRGGRVPQSRSYSPRLRADEEAEGGGCAESRHQSPPPSRRGALPPPRVLVVVAPEHVAGSVAGTYTLSSLPDCAASLDSLVWEDVTGSGACVASTADGRWALGGVLVSEAAHGGVLPPHAVGGWAARCAGGGLVEAPGVHVAACLDEGGASPQVAPPPPPPQQQQQLVPAPLGRGRERRPPTGLISPRGDDGLDAASLLEALQAEKEKNAHLVETLEQTQMQQSIVNDTVTAAFQAQAVAEQAVAWAIGRLGGPPGSEAAASVEAAAHMSAAQAELPQQPMLGSYGAPQYDVAM